MKKLILTCFGVLLLGSRLAFATDIYVSNGGNDANSGNTSGTPKKTLWGAYNKIDIAGDAGTVTYNIILMDDGGDILIHPTLDGFNWTESGTASYPINIYSEDCNTATITRTGETAVMLKLLNVSYINFNNIKFENAVRGTFMLDNADYCRIEFCEFFSESATTYTSGGVIWVGRQNGTAGSYSSYNQIVDNIFYDMDVTGHDTLKVLHHAIYVSNYSSYNSISNNTIQDPPSYGIHFYHGSYTNNNANYNMITQNQGNGVGSNALIFGVQAPHTVASIVSNQGTVNYVHDNQAPFDAFPASLPSSNDPHNNGEQGLNHQYSTLYPNDPHWLGYQPGQISYRVASGDFDKNDSLDDIAAIYDNGDGTASIHVWNTDNTSNRAFIYSGGESDAWWDGSYSAGNVTGRVVSGDFDRDGDEDDLAAFHYTGTTTQIHVWTSTGSAFNNYGVWWNPGAGVYNATKITYRVVSGDFDGDNYKDDIAAVYDNGGSGAQMHVWQSSGSSFSHSTGWWSGVSYDETKVTGRVVSGDFDNDTKKDDIIAFHDNGSNNTSAHIWKSNGSSFTQTTSGWWDVSGYNANMITGKVAAGDIDNDNKFDDIVAFYDGGGTTTTIHLWASSGTALTYYNPWWTSSGYDQDNIVGRVVVGNFDGDAYTDDVSAFYDRGSFCGSVRTNVWRSNAGAAAYMNGSMGYPWISTGYYERAMAMPEPTDIVSFEEETSHDMMVYPNPFSGSTEIRYSLAESSRIELVIYSIDGQKITTLVDETQAEGAYINTWNADDANGNRVSPGVYFCTFKNGDNILTKKIVLMN